eukprot:5007705-Amphidinium_carterae.1
MLRQSPGCVHVFTCRLPAARSCIDNIVLGWVKNTCCLREPHCSDSLVNKFPSPQERTAADDFGRQAARGTVRKSYITRLVARPLAPHTRNSRSSSDSI